jgi:chromosomal replication initiator protein
LQRPPGELCALTVDGLICTMKNAWEVIKQELHAVLSAENFRNWFSRAQFSRMDGRTLHVQVPDRETQIWLESEYSDPILSIARKHKIEIDRVSYEVRKEESTLSTMLESRLDTKPIENEVESSLNPRFTFETFVVGSSNQFAHAAARSVAAHPSRSYNPLFIYGSTGMGKTHLMHAIGRELMAQGTIRVIYTSAERFTNEVVTGIRLERMHQLRARYRSADVLLIDDIQIIGNKERTQEEFFHTFNELHDAQKQIVISCDSPPKGIPGLVERLRSRFEWGLLADIQPPDLETKMAILDKKAELDGVRLPEDVRTYMATKSRSNIRELEGALIKLIAYSSLTGAPITMPMAQQALKHMLHEQERRITIDSIQKATAEKFNVRQAQLKEKSNAKDIVRPRQVAMYLVKELTKASLPEIGRAFGNKHHTTVIHSIRKIDELRKSDVELNKTINSLIDSLQ